MLEVVFVMFLKALNFGPTLFPWTRLYYVIYVFQIGVLAVALIMRVRVCSQNLKKLKNVKNVKNLKNYCFCM